MPDHSKAKLYSTLRSELQQLAEACDVAATAFRVAAQYADDKLRKEFDDLAQKHVEFAEALRESRKKLRRSVPTGALLAWKLFDKADTPLSALPPSAGWIQIKSVLVNAGVENLFADCAEGENSLLTKYQSALQNEPLKAAAGGSDNKAVEEALALINAQMSAVEKVRGELKERHDELQTQATNKQAGRTGTGK